MKDFQKFDVFFIDLNPKKGHAQAGIRPCVLIQSNLFNQYGSTLVVVPVTTNQKKIFPSEFLIEPSESNGLKQVSRFLGSQIMTIDKEFVRKKIGSLEECYHEEVQKALSVALDWENDF